MDSGEGSPPPSIREQTFKEEDLHFQREEVTEEGIFVSNAGLILLHPFLPTLFKRLYLWNGAGFADVDAWQKAIFILHFMATGRTDAEEYELAFPKMLCGYALEMPLPAEIPLTQEECGEAILLIESAIRTWEKLQQTSVAGLREGFLQRSGKLVEKSGQLYLMVESAGIDVLLDFLPWNLSLVKLPWLKDILHVEWR